jgi:hypothetical protein
MKLYDGELLFLSLLCVYAFVINADGVSDLILMDCVGGAIRAKLLRLQLSACR